VTPGRRAAASNRGPVRAVAASLARRRQARAPRVLVRTGGGQPQTLAPTDPAAAAALEAAESLISAAQRGSGA
jgi:hypothetical protein